MPAGAGKSECTFRRIVASGAISSSDLETAERLLARFVALAYAGDHPDQFPSAVVDKTGIGRASRNSGHVSRSDRPPLLS
jgi:hypothetical protein